LLREGTGLSAREWWDRLRISADLITEIRNDIRRTLAHDPKYYFAVTPPGGWQVVHLINTLRRIRRDKGWTPVSRAYRLGFRNVSRLKQAFWTATHQTLAEFEARVLTEERVEFRAFEKELRAKQALGAPPDGLHTLCNFFQKSEGASGTAVSTAVAPTASAPAATVSAPGQVAGAPAASARPADPLRTTCNIFPKPQSSSRVAQAPVPERASDFVAPVQTIRRTGPRILPNDRCPCGSGRKHKKCCGRMGGNPAIPAPVQAQSAQEPQLVGASAR
jgi:hypothetical protein